MDEQGCYEHRVHQWNSCVLGKDSRDNRECTNCLREDRHGDACLASDSEVTAENGACGLIGFKGGVMR